jgi:hypothetical protein
MTFLPLVSAKGFRVYRKGFRTYRVLHGRPDTLANTSLQPISWLEYIKERSIKGRFELIWLLMIIIFVIWGVLVACR